MDETLIEIREYAGPGYQSLIDYDTWRVAILNYLEEIHPKRIAFMERHNETDEVFVLMRGKGIIFLGEGVTRIETINSYVMEPGRIYNVRKSVWHTIVLSRDGSVLIVENRNTGKENSHYSALNKEQRQKVVETAQREQEDWE
jgi:ureidoglycolate hydrolase